MASHYVIGNTEIDPNNLMVGEFAIVEKPEEYRDCVITKAACPNSDSYMFVVVYSPTQNPFMLTLSDKIDFLKLRRMPSTDHVVLRNP